MDLTSMITYVISDIGVDYMHQSLARSENQAGDMYNIT